MRRAVVLIEDDISIYCRYLIYCTFLRTTLAFVMDVHMDIRYSKDIYFRYTEQRIYLVSRLHI